MRCLGRVSCRWPLDGRFRGALAARRTAYAYRKQRRLAPIAQLNPTLGPLILSLTSRVDDKGDSVLYSGSNLLGHAYRAPDFLSLIPD